MQPRYPQIHVCTRSRNPLTLVAAIREELRRARVDEREIHRFSRQALTAAEPERVRQICRRWAVVD
jgi:SOS response regulatory protein OraA/RecX